MLQVQEPEFGSHHPHNQSDRPSHTYNPISEAATTASRGVETAIKKNQNPKPEDKGRLTASSSGSHWVHGSLCHPHVYAHVLNKS